MNSLPPIWAAILRYVGYGTEQRFGCSIKHCFELKRTIRSITVSALLLLAPMTIVGQADELQPAQKHPIDLTNMSLEDLMNLEVTSVSKKEQKLSQTAAAIYVVTQEDIRRSGATSIPEVLRMVPGLQVARLSGSKWAITSRGFNGRFANKMLVLVDGRSVYTPTFSGVFWDVQDLLLEDVERIEVIRGPGGTLWGANAVNGVINIITKPAKETQGGFLTAGSGSEERGFGGFRYGGKLGRDIAYRLYSKYFNRSNLADMSGRNSPGGWDILRGGFRMDWKGTERDSLTLQGDIYNGHIRERNSSIVSLVPPFRRTLDSQTGVSGGNVMALWNRTFAGGSAMRLQMYYDRTRHEDSSAVITSRGEIVDSSDLDFQHRFALGKRQDIVWGIGYRFTSDSVQNTFSVAFDPNHRATHLFSTFVQDEIFIVKDRLRLTVGSKFEHNDYTGFEAQPSLRLLWTPNDRHTFWGAISVLPQF